MVLALLYGCSAVQYDMRGGGCVALVQKGINHIIGWRANLKPQGSGHTDTTEHWRAPEKLKPCVEVLSGLRRSQRCSTFEVAVSRILNAGGPERSSRPRARRWTNRRVIHTQWDEHERGRVKPCVPSALRSSTSPAGHALLTRRGPGHRRPQRHPSVPGTTATPGKPRSPRRC